MAWGKLDLCDLGTFSWAVFTSGTGSAFKEIAPGFQACLYSFSSMYRVCDIPRRYHNPGIADHRSDVLRLGFWISKDDIYTGTADPNVYFHVHHCDCRKYSLGRKGTAALEQRIFDKRRSSAGKLCFYCDTIILMYVVSCQWHI